MPNYYYIDSQGQRQGLISDAQLQVLASHGIITPMTHLETEGGHQGVAGQVPGLKFKTPTQTPAAQSMPSPTIPAIMPMANVYCTNCGNAVAEHAVACMNCGAKPTGHKKFCRHCSTALNAEQVICIKCGSAIDTAKKVRGGAGSHTSWEKNKLVAGLLGILLGGVGAQKYYMGSWGWGIVFTAVAVLSMGFLAFVTGLISLVEGIMFLVMSDDTFAEKYPQDTEHPFRW